MRVPESWVDAGEEVVAKGGPVVVIGKVDTGKSTLTRYLFQRAREVGRRVALVDADIGQASFGPPTCMSLTFPPAKRVLRFIGATSPAGRLLQVAAGVKLLAERAEAAGAELILIDTGGMIEGPLGVLLKRHKIELVHPKTLLVLQRSEELAPLLETLPRFSNMEIRLLPVSPEARVRPAAERRAWRREGFSAYFQGARSRWIDLSPPRRWLLGPAPSVGALIGLLDIRGETVGLGVARRIESRKAQLATPVRRLEPVRFLQVGGIRLGPDWGEAPDS